MQLLNLMASSGDLVWNGHGFVSLGLGDKSGPQLNCMMEQEKDQDSRWVFQVSESYGVARVAGNLASRCLGLASRSAARA